jgi:Pro-kumamolisin, activation domain/Bacterial Ig-like domain (group 3)
MKRLQLRSATYGRFASTLAISACTVAFVLASSSPGMAQTSRLSGQIDASRPTKLIGTQFPMARAENDIGRVSSEKRLEGMTLVLSQTTGQTTDLEALIAAQQDPSSPLYHKWLSPEEYASRFGISDADIATIDLWLQQQGFTVDGVARGKSRITFSGTVLQVESAFSTELHYYRNGTRTEFAPSTNLSIPVGLSGVVRTVENLSSFRPQARVRFKAPQRTAGANFTSSQSGNHYLTPKDVATIYDINQAYNSGINGTGQSIAIVGQSAVALSDIENFQKAAGLTVKDPTEVLVSGSGTATVYSGDEAESDLDLEYSGAIAKGATIYFVYVGNNLNYSVWDSIQYAVDNKIAPIISNSYGECETALGSAEYATYNAILAQAAAQGQTVVTAAGDNGSTDCYGTSGLTTTQQVALGVDFPASSQYVTAIGGTEFPSVDTSSSNSTYWQSTSGSDVIGSALSYIPEQVWNDDSSSGGLSSGGGGVSVYTARPSWQTGVTGIASGSYRLVPDISLDASPQNAGYLYCSSDYSSTGISGSCTNGFRDSNNVYLTVAGGTSFGAPIFSGMIALINQKKYPGGQGVVNSTLYSLAGNSTTYGSAFHDITSGSNECSAGSSNCSGSGTSEYPATTGYDEASGLGSIDFYNLLSAWPATASSGLASSATTLSASTLTPAAGASDAITIKIASASTSSNSIPTGTVAILVDGSTVSSALSLSGGTATYAFSSTTAGAHVIQATYSGDTTFASSSASLTITVGSSSNTIESFSVSATNLTVAAGSSGTSSVTVTPANGYTGSISWNLSTSSSTLTNACYVIANTTVSGTTAVAASLTIYTSASDCSGGSSTGTLDRAVRSLGNRSSNLPQIPWSDSAGEVAALTLLFAGALKYRRVPMRLLVALVAISTVALLLNGCGVVSSVVPGDYAPKGTYTLTLTGTDTAVSSLQASTSITLTID